jgi:hypothetical protein
MGFKRAFDHVQVTCLNEGASHAQSSRPQQVLLDADTSGDDVVLHESNPAPGMSSCFRMRSQLVPCIHIYICLGMSMMCKSSLLLLSTEGTLRGTL